MGGAARIGGGVGWTAPAKPLNQKGGRICSRLWLGSQKPAAGAIRRAVHGAMSVGYPVARCRHTTDRIRTS